MVELKIVIVITSLQVRVCVEVMALVGLDRVGQPPLELLSVEDVELLLAQLFGVARVSFDEAVRDFCLFFVSCFHSYF